MTQTYNAQRAIPADDETLEDHAARANGADEDAGADENPDNDAVVDDHSEAVSSADTDTDATGNAEDDDDDLGVDDPAVLEAVLNADQSHVPANLAAKLRRERREAEAETAAFKVRLQEIEQREQARRETPKKRDFDAELTDLRKRYKADDSTMSEEDYEAARDEIRDAKAEVRLMEKIAPEVIALRQTVANRERDVQMTRLQAAADKVYERYPFLNIDDPNVNDQAVADVVAERDDLIRRGVDPVRALHLAVAEHAPKYVPRRRTAAADVDGDNKADEIAAARRAQARKAALAATSQQAPSLRGQGTGGKEVQDGTVLGRSVDDHEKWLKMDEGQRAKVKVAH